MSKLSPFSRVMGNGAASAPQARGGAVPLDKMGSKVSPEASEGAAEALAPPALKSKRGVACNTPLFGYAGAL